MKENQYDNPSFFDQYKRMPRSTGGLKSAGEWHALMKMLPEFNNKRVLDLGCGFGWHCRYAIEHGAKSVVGIDLSEKMLGEARARTTAGNIEYIRMPIEDVNFDNASFDIVISSLVFHYVESFDDICKNVSRMLKEGGEFVFSVEHPIFTAYGNQDWFYDEKGNKLHWPVDHYFTEGRREAVFLGQKVVKYHKTMTTYINTLLYNGFQVTKLIEPEPSPEMLKENDSMKEELRRPMMLLISAGKKGGKG